MAAGDNISTVNVTGSQTKTGSSDNVAGDAVIRKGETDVTADYAITCAKGTLTVTRAETNEVTVEIESWNYGEKAKEPTYTADFGVDTAVIDYLQIADADGNKVESTWAWMMR